MSAEPRRRLLLSALVIVAAGLAAWLWLREERAGMTPARLQPGASAAAPSASAPAASAPARLEPSAGATAPAKPGADAAPEPSAPQAAVSSEPTTAAMSVDERQDAKIARGLASAAEGGLLVESSPPASVVAALRLQPGDVIVTVNGASVSTPADFVRVYRAQGMPAELTILRAGREMHLHSTSGAP